MHIPFVSYCPSLNFIYLNISDKFCRLFHGTEFCNLAHYDVIQKFDKLSLRRKYAFDQSDQIYGSVVKGRFLSQLV